MINKAILFYLSNREEFEGVRFVTAAECAVSHVGRPFRTVEIDYCLLPKNNHIRTSLIKIMVLQRVNRSIRFEFNTNYFDRKD